MSTSLKSMIVYYYAGHLETFRTESEMQLKPVLRACGLVVFEHNVYKYMFYYRPCYIVCLFLLLYVPCQQLWSLRDGQFT